jgi:hypothetical protein
MHRIENFGWAVGITYNTPSSTGLNREYLFNLLDDMSKHHMNRLSLMMIAYALYDNVHDGYCWPVQNPKLKSYLDTDAYNSNPNTEFVSEVIQKAADLGIEVELTMNYGIWNNSKIRKSYPTASLQQTFSKDMKGRYDPWIHCPDNPDCWQLGLDEMRDLLTFYNHPNVRGFVVERLGYVGKDFCYCLYTQQKFKEETGNDMLRASEKEVFEWKITHTSKLITEFANEVHKIRPDIQLGLHTVGNLHWGHEPRRFKECGVGFAEPHTIQHKTGKKELYQTWDHLTPNPLLLYFDGRDKAPPNYPIIIKTPKIIHQTLQWIFNYGKPHISGILFFNESSLSIENRSAIYEAIDRYNTSL